MKNINNKIRTRKINEKAIPDALHGMAFFGGCAKKLFYVGTYNLSQVEH